MARRKRLYLSGYTYHVVHRGNNRQAVFNQPIDFIRYQDYLLDALLRYGVLCHAYVLMTNHVHLLLSPGSSDGISRVMSLLGNRFVQYVNHRDQRSGTLFEGRHYSCAVATDHYLWSCYRYIELNPVRAGLVKHPDSWYWSSFASNALGVVSELVTPHRCYLGLGRTDQERCRAYRGMFSSLSYAEDFDEIRTATRSGDLLGEAPGPLPRLSGGAFSINDGHPPRYR